MYRKRLKNMWKSHEATNKIQTIMNKEYKNITQ